VVDQRTLVVAGSGVAIGTPDQCVLSLSLNGIGTTPAETLDICSTAAEGAIAAAVGAGVEQDDVRTVNLSVQDYFDQAKQKVTARIGSYQLEVVLRNLDDVGRVLGVLSEASGDALQIRSLQLGLKNVEPVRKAARREAVRDAQEKARDLAEAAGLQLGEILTLEDNERSGPQGVRTMALASARPPASVPVEPGQVSVAVSVTITYAISTS
jgi:uncharacterized protein YggE